MNAVEVSGECYETNSWDGDTMNSLGCGILCFREDLKNICVLIVQFYFGILPFFLNWRIVTVLCYCQLYGKVNQLYI